MALTKLQDFQMVHDAALPNAGLPARSTLKDIVAQVNAELDGPLRLTQSATPDGKLNFSAASVAASDGAGKAPTPINRSSKHSLPQGDIDFQARTSTAPMAAGWTFQASAVGMYRRVAFTLNSAGQIVGTWSPEAATLASLSDPGILFAAGGLPIGWIDLQCTDSAGSYKTAGSSQNVIENKPAGALAPTIFRVYGGKAIGDEPKTPMKLHQAYPTPDCKLYLEGSQVQTGDGTGLSSPPLKSSIAMVASSTIDFVTRATTGATFRITWPASSTIGKVRRMGLTMNADGSLQGLFSAEAADVASLPNPGSLFLASGIPVGWVDLEATSTGFKTAGSATDVIENSVSGSTRIYNFGSGGAGSGSGDGGAAKSPADGFQWLTSDKLDSDPSSSDSLIDTSNTPSDSYSSAAALHQLAFDKSPLITAAGTSFSLSKAPTGFALAVGNVVWVASQGTFRRVASVSSATAGTLDAAFPAANFTSVAGMVAQALWTKDLVSFGDADQKTRAMDAFPSTDVTEIHLEYSDSAAIGDEVSDLVDSARIVASASNYGLQSDLGLPATDKFSAIFRRPAYPNQVPNYTLSSFGSRQRLFLVFFPDPALAAATSSSNLLDFDVSMYGEQALLNGGVLNSAFCMSDGTGAPNNCQPAVVVNGKTQVQLSFSFVPGINPSQVGADLTVYVEGLKVPRWYSGIVGGYWKEVAGTSDTIEFWADLSGSSFSIEVERRQGSIDTSDSNAKLLAANFLGSSDATVDRSSPGRGIFLRRPDGTLREICIDDNDNIVVYSI